MVVKWVRLDQVDNVKPIILASFGVTHTEVVPLSIAPCVVIRFQNKIILVLINLNGSSQVSTFKSWFKNEGVVIWALRNIVWGDFALRSFTLLEWRGIKRVIDHSVHEVFLVGNSVSFSSQAFFKDEFLRGIHGLKVVALFYVKWWILHMLHGCACLDCNYHIIWINHARICFTFMTCLILGWERPTNILSLNLRWVLKGLRSSRLTFKKLFATKRVLSSPKNL